MVAIAYDSPLEAYAARELSARFTLATASQRERGRRWYPEYQRRMRKLARKYGTTTARAAAVGAITSPNSHLATNLKWTEAILAGERTYGQYEATQAWKIRAALDPSNPRPSAFAIGPKVSVFYRAIMGDPNAITLDRWAAHAAGLGRQTPPTQTQQALLRRVYDRVAAEHGETPRDIQAIIWTQAREADARGKLQDITH